ncbi:MAG: phenylacetate--CoA ligase, partial [Clostridiales bacterium]|nr:phenylacetate--CoA ligase [Clostridiales bacterium]
EAALLTVDGTTPHYMLVVDRVGNSDTLEVQVEVAEDTFTDEVKSLESLRKTIHDKLRMAIGLNAKVTLMEPNGLEHFDGKSKHVIDKRKLYQ